MSTHTTAEMETFYKHESTQTLREWSEGDVDHSDVTTSAMVRCMVLVARLEAAEKKLRSEHKLHDHAVEKWEEYMGKYHASEAMRSGIQ